MAGPSDGFSAWTGAGGAVPHGADGWSAGKAGCGCGAADAELASEFLRRARTVADLVDESHLGVRLIACGGCGQIFLRIFTELIDWSGGDDSQAWVSVPIDADEAGRLRAGLDWAEFARGVPAERRFLATVHPRGGTSGTSWHTGGVPFFPHD